MVVRGSSENHCRRNATQGISRPAAARRSPSVLVANARAVGWEGEGKVAYVHEKLKKHWLGLSQPAERRK